MGTQSTEEVTREEAIRLIANKFSEVITRKLKYFSSKKLERLLDEYVEDTWTNYVVEYDYNDEEEDDRDYSFIDEWLNI